MGNLLYALNVIAPYFVLLAIGYSIKKPLLGKETFLSTANKLVFKVALPIKLFLNIYHIDVSKVINLKLFTYAGLSIIIVTCLSMVFYHFFSHENRIKGALIQATFRSNYVIFGTSIATSMYGMEGAASASILAILIVPLLNVLAVIILELYGNRNDEYNTKGIIIRIIKNPLIIGIILGFIANVLNFALPQFLISALSDIGGCSTPLALLILGAQFSFASLSKNIKYVAVGTIGKLVVVPIIGLSGSVVLGFRNIELIVLMLLFASPTAVASYVMATEAGVDGELAGQLVASTTFFASFSIFIIVFLLRTYGLA